MLSRACHHTCLSPSHTCPPSRGTPLPLPPRRHDTGAPAPHAGTAVPRHLPLPPPAAAPRGNLSHRPPARGRATGRAPWRATRTFRCRLAAGCGRQVDTLHWRGFASSTTPPPYTGVAGSVPLPFCSLSPPSVPAWLCPFSWRRQPYTATKHLVGMGSRPPCNRAERLLPLQSISKQRTD